MCIRDRKSVLRPGTNACLRQYCGLVQTRSCASTVLFVLSVLRACTAWYRMSRERKEQKGRKE
eukprot:3506773-Rhodomonas_salina.1